MLTHRVTRSPSIVGAAAGLAVTAASASAQQTIDFGTITQSDISETLYGGGLDNRVTIEDSYGFSVSGGVSAGGFTTQCFPLPPYPCGSFFNPRICRPSFCISSGADIKLESSRTALDFDYRLELLNGPINVTATLAPTLAVPAPAAPGNFQRIEGQFTTTGTNTITSTFGGVDAGFGLDFETNLNADVRFQLPGDQRRGETVVNTTIAADFELLGVEDGRYEVLGFGVSPPSGDDGFRIPIPIPASFQSDPNPGDPIIQPDICGDLGAIVIYELEERTRGGSLNSGRLEVSQQIPVADIEFDLDSILFCVNRIPNAGGVIEYPGPWGLVEIDTIDLDWTPQIAIEQKIALEPGVEVMLEFDRFVSVRDEFGNVTKTRTIVSPIDQLPPFAFRDTSSLTVTPSVRYSGTLSNLTALTFSTPIDFEILSADWDVLFGALGSVNAGPAFSTEIPLNTVTGVAGLSTSIPGVPLYEDERPIRSADWVQGTTFSMSPRLDYSVFTGNASSSWGNSGNWVDQFGNPTGLPNSGTDVQIVPGVPAITINTAGSARSGNLTVPEGTDINLGSVFELGGLIENNGTITKTSGVGRIVSLFDSTLGGDGLYKNISIANGYSATPSNITLVEGAEFLYDAYGIIGIDTDGGASRAKIVNNAKITATNPQGTSTGFIEIEGISFENGPEGEVLATESGFILMYAQQGVNRGLIRAEDESMINIFGTNLTGFPSSLRGRIEVDTGSAITVLGGLIEGRVLVDNGSQLNLLNDAVVQPATIIDVTNNSTLDIYTASVRNDIITIDESSSLIAGSVQLSEFLGEIVNNGTVEFRGNVDIGQLTTGNSVGTSILTNNGTVFASSGADVNIDGFIPFTGKTRDWLSEGVWVIEGLTAPTFVDITSRYANPADDVPGQSPPLFNRNGGRVNAADVTLRGPSAFFAWLENSMEQNLGSLSIELGKEFQVSGDLENQGDIFVDSASTLLIAGDYTQLDGSLSVSQSGLVAVTNGDFSIGLSPEPDSLFMSDGANVNVNGDVVLGESANVEFLIFGTSSGNEYGQVEATGAVTLGGKVSVRFDPSYLPAAGDEFVLFNSLSNQMDGDLPIVEAQGLPNDLRLEAGFDGTSLILYVVDDQFRIDSIFPRRLQAAQVNEFEVRVSRLAGEAPVSEVLEYRVNGGEELFAWTAPANAGVFNAQLPALQCGDQVEFRLVVTANDGTRVSKPFQGFAAAEVVTALTTFDDPADTDLGYTTQTSVGLASGDWFIGTPGGSGPGVPAVDADGSGSAWLTGASGDVDDGGSRLITPALQVGANTVISYSYWISGADAAPFDEDDGLYVQISTDSVSFETIRSYNNPGPAWRRDSLVGGVDFNADADVFTDTVYLRFIARDRQDNGIDSIVEAGIDALLVESDLAVDTFRDTGDTNLGWSPALAGGSSGRWEIGVPLGLGRGDPETDADGSGSAWLTDPSDGLDSDVDGTSLMTSPVIEIGGGTSVSYAYWLNDEPSAPLNSDDNLTVLVSTNGGATYQAVRTYTTASPVWRRDTLVEGIDYNTDPANMSGTLRLQFRAADREVGTPTTLEAGIDDLVVTGPDCSSQCPADLAAPFGVLNFFDIQLFLSIFGDGSLDADLTGDGALNFFDIQEFLAAFNAGCP